MTAGLLDLYFELRLSLVGNPEMRIRFDAVAERGGVRVILYHETGRWLVEGFVGEEVIYHRIVPHMTTFAHAMRRYVHTAMQELRLLGIAERRVEHVIGTARLR